MNNTFHQPLKAIPKYFSIYLDFLRFGAAVFVLLFHFKKLEIGPEFILRFIPDRGHDFVIMFFVLSGYVIAATVDRKKEKGLREYVIDRLARVYSVALPALFVSFCFLITFSLIDIKVGNGFLDELGYIAINFFFLGQTWWQGAFPFQVGPYWSLNYEVMYYIGFACFVFFSGIKRWTLLITFSLLVGPKILALIPCWLLGVLIYHWRDRWVFKFWPALILAFVLPVTIAIALNQMHFGAYVREVTPQLLGDYYPLFGFSDYFIADYLTATIVAINIYLMRFVLINWPQWLEIFILKGASISFTLYLMHMPFLYIILRLTDRSERGILVFLVGLLGVMTVCYVISLLTEARKNGLRQWLDTHLPFKQV